MTQTKAEQYGSPNNEIRRYHTNLTPRPMAERYAEQIEMSLPAFGLPVAAKEWADELRRLSQIEAERDKLIEVNRTLYQALLRLGRAVSISPSADIGYVKAEMQNAQQALKLSGDSV